MSSRDAQEDFLRQAIELARAARAEGNHPFGSLLTIDDKVVLTGKNTVFTDRDPTAHAETNLVADAIRRLSPEEIRRSVLYTSCEPCAMCAGKLYWAGIRSVVFALSSEQLGEIAGRNFLIPCTVLFAHAAEKVTVVGPLLLSEAREVHIGYWPPTRTEAI